MQKKAVDYWSFCEEKGCDWEGLFNSIDCKMDSVAIMKLPENLTTMECFAVANKIMQRRFNHD